MRDMVAFDCHEHIPSARKLYRETYGDGADIIHVLRGFWIHDQTDLPSDTPKTLDQYEELSRTLKTIAGNGHLIACIRAIKEIYDVDIVNLDAKSLMSASGVIKSFYEKEDWHATLIKKYANVQRVVTEHGPWTLWNDELFSDYSSAALNTDIFTACYNRTVKGGAFADYYRRGLSVFTWADELGRQISDFDDYLGFVDYIFSQARSKGFICVKSKLAYERDLFFDIVKEEDVRNIFGKDSVTPSQKKQFSDYMVHYIIRKSIEYDFPIKIHTGLVGLPALGLDVKGRYEGINPLNLVNLFHQHPDANFVLLHGGFPWSNEIASLPIQKYRNNVNVDIGWSVLVSRRVTKALLRDLISITGGRRIMWGGDTGSGEAVYGSLNMTKDIIAQVLTEYVEDNVMSSENALGIAENILMGNATSIFKQ